MNDLLKFVIGWGIAAYVADVLLRPSAVAADAQREAEARGKPLLNVGCGTAGSSLRAALLGVTSWGDANCDIAATGNWDGTKRPCHCDAMRLPFADKQFGAAIASHVLEHVDDPRAAMAELRRVADVVFVIVPKWWAPHTWLHPGHRWYVREQGQCVPLWPEHVLRPGPRRALPGRRRYRLGK